MCPHACAYRIYTSSAMVWQRITSASAGKPIRTLRAQPLSPVARLPPALHSFSDSLGVSVRSQPQFRYLAAAPPPFPSCRRVVHPVRGQAPVVTVFGLASHLGDGGTVENARRVIATASRRWAARRLRVPAGRPAQPGLEDGESPRSSTPTPTSARLAIITPTAAARLLLCRSHEQWADTSAAVQFSREILPGAHASHAERGITMRSRPHPCPYWVRRQRRRAPPSATSPRRRSTSSRSGSTTATAPSPRCRHRSTPPSSRRRTSTGSA